MIVGTVLEVPVEKTAPPPLALLIFRHPWLPFAFWAWFSPPQPISDSVSCLVQCIQ